MFLRSQMRLGHRCFSVQLPAITSFEQRVKYPVTFVKSDLTPDKYNKRPIPLNVKLTHYSPLKLPLTYGDLVAEVTLSSFYGTKDIDFVSDFLMRAAFYLGIPAKGPTPLPQKIKRWTVIRSPFVHAKSKENWERQTWRRQIKLYDANPEVVQILLAIAAKHQMAGVGVHATVFTQETLNSVLKLDVAPDEDRLLALNKVDLATEPNGKVAKAVLELLNDPRFANSVLKSQSMEDLGRNSEDGNSKIATHRK